MVRGYRLSAIGLLRFNGSTWFLRFSAPAHCPEWPSNPSIGLVRRGVPAQGFGEAAGSNAEAIHQGLIARQFHHAGGHRVYVAVGHQESGFSVPNRISQPRTIRG